MIPPIRYVPHFISDPIEVCKTLREELAWVRRENTPRCEYYTNDFEQPYTYGEGRGVREYRPQPTHPLLDSLRHRVEQETGSIFEASFLNLYLDQRDHLGWHADDSPELDDGRPIAILSFGVEREIWFKPIVPSDGLVTKLTLGNGSLCLMLPFMQKSWKHRIPKASFTCGIRISITMRGYAHQNLGPEPMVLP